MNLLTTLAFLGCMGLCLGSLVPQVDNIETIVKKNQRSLNAMAANPQPRHDYDVVSSKRTEQTPRIKEFE